MGTYSEYSHAASANANGSAHNPTASAASSKVNTDDLRTYLQAIGLPLQIVAIQPDTGKLQVHRATNDIELKDVLWRAKSLNGRGIERGIYAEVNIGGKLGRGGKPARNSEADITHIRLIAGDTDAKDGVTMEQCEALVDALPRQPSFTVMSGGGFQPHFKLHEPVEATPGNIAKARAASAGLAVLLGGDKTISIEHLFRVPGFTNWPNKKKREAGRVPVKATIREDTGLTYSLDDLFEAFGKHASQEVDDVDDALGDIAGRMPAALAAHTDADNADLKQEYQPSDAHKIADACKVVGEMRDKRGNVEEPLWRAVLGVLAYTIQGDAVCHAYSSGYDGYTEAETQSKIDRFRANATRRDALRDVKPPSPGSLRCLPSQRVSNHQ